MYKTAFSTLWHRCIVGFRITSPGTEELWEREYTSLVKDIINILGNVVGEDMAQVRKSVDSPPGMLPEDPHHTVHEESQVRYSSHLRTKSLHLLVDRFCRSIGRTIVEVIQYILLLLLYSVTYCY